MLAEGTRITQPETLGHEGLGFAVASWHCIGQGWCSGAAASGLVTWAWVLGKRSSPPAMAWGQLEGRQLLVPPLEMTRWGEF